MDIQQMSGSPNIFHEGIFYLDDSPLYIVEYYDNEHEIETYATIYDVASISKKEDAPEEAKQFPRKAYEKKTVKRGFGNKTLLSRKASKVHEPEEFVREVEKPPLFLARLQRGTDTFLGIEGMGFYERTKDRQVKRGDKIVMEGGENTGVFITLESIDWRRHYVPTSEAVNKYRANRSIWSELL